MKKFRIGQKLKVVGNGSNGIKHNFSIGIEVKVVGKTKSGNMYECEGPGQNTWDISQTVSKDDLEPRPSRKKKPSNLELMVETKEHEETLNNSLDLLVMGHLKDSDKGLGDIYGSDYQLRKHEVEVDMSILDDHLDKVFDVSSNLLVSSPGEVKSSSDIGKEITDPSPLPNSLDFLFYPGQICEIINNSLNYQIMVNQNVQIISCSYSVGYGCNVYEVKSFEGKVGLILEKDLKKVEFKQETPVDKEEIKKKMEEFLKTSIPFNPLIPNGYESPNEIIFMGSDKFLEQAKEFLGNPPRGLEIGFRPPLPNIPQPPSIKPDVFLLGGKGSFPYSQPIGTLQSINGLDISQITIDDFIKQWKQVNMGIVNHRPVVGDEFSVHYLPGIEPLEYTHDTGDKDFMGLVSVSTCTVTEEGKLKITGYRVISKDEEIKEGLQKYLDSIKDYFSTLEMSSLIKTFTQGINQGTTHVSKDGSIDMEGFPLFNTKPYEVSRELWSKMGRERIPNYEPNKPTYYWRVKDKSKRRRDSDDREWEIRFNHDVTRKHPIPLKEFIKESQLKYSVKKSLNKK